MRRISASLLFLVLGCCSCGVGAQESHEPLRQTRLLALVAGAALPENIVAAIHDRGVGFQPNSVFRTQVETVGADTRILAALDSARVVIPNGKKQAPNNEELEHIVNAAKLIQSKQFPEGAAELTAVLNATFESPESGFVMGQMLRVQERWPEAMAVYSEVLRQDPNFPEAHTKLSYIWHRMEDEEEALREAKAALKATPDNPEAHKNAGLALAAMRKFDAADAEYEAALRLKPDYEPVRYDLALMYSAEGDVNGAIVQYKKAIALDPSHVDAHYNLGLAYEKKGDFDSSIREYREVKRLDPTRYDGRHNLAAELLNHNFNAEAVLEFREIEKDFPDVAVCHYCLGLALHRTWDLAGAEKEFLLAIKLDPSDPLPHVGLGAVRETQKRYDESLVEYQLAEKIDPNSVEGYLGAGRVLFTKKNYGHALDELKQAEGLKPSNAYVHEQYAKALQASGDSAGAVSEFQQAIALTPGQVPVMIELAEALEKKGDWAESVEEYHQAALLDASADYRTKITRMDAANPEIEYKQAQERLNLHSAALKSAGKSAEAAALEARIHNMEAAPNLSEKIDAAMQAGNQANQLRHFDEAMKHFQEAVDLAEKMQPRDQRLVTALDRSENHQGRRVHHWRDLVRKREARLPQERRNNGRNPQRTRHHRFPGPGQARDFRAEPRRNRETGRHVSRSPRRSGKILRRATTRNSLGRHSSGVFLRRSDVDLPQHSVPLHLRRIQDGRDCADQRREFHLAAPQSHFPRKREEPHPRTDFLLHT